MRAFAHLRPFRPTRLTSWRLALYPALLLGGCSIAPDPYLGTIDPTGWDARFGGVSVLTNTPPCVAPLTALRGNAGNASNSSWYYLGNFSLNQLDLLKTQDPTRPLPPEGYRISGCAPAQGAEANFNYRDNNFETDRQYPVFPGNSPEPTSAATYSPFFFVTPVAVRDQQVGCNDVRSERTLLDRGGWDRGSLSFMDAARSSPLDVQRPSRENIRAGMVTMVDWPLFNLTAPLMRPDKGDAANRSGATVVDRVKACPFQANNTAKIPTKIGDPDASFSYANLGWLRGLLTGFMDAGEVPLQRGAKSCLSLFETGAACTADADCKTGATVCNTESGRCVATTVQVDTGVSCRDSNGMPSTAICASCSPTSLRCMTTASLTDTRKDCNMTACDSSKGEICSGGVGKRTCKVSPLSICPAVTDIYVPDVESYALAGGSVTLGSGMSTRAAPPMTVFSAARGDQGFSPVCRVRRYDSKALDAKLTMDPAACLGREESMVAPRPRCTADQLKAAGVVLAETELSFVNCVFPSP